MSWYSYVDEHRQSGCTLRSHGYCTLLETAVNQHLIHAFFATLSVLHSGCVTTRSPDRTGEFSKRQPGKTQSASLGRSPRTPKRRWSTDRRVSFGSQVDRIVRNEHGYSIRLQDKTKGFCSLHRGDALGAAIHRVVRMKRQQKVERTELVHLAGLPILGISLAPTPTNRREHITAAPLAGFVLTCVLYESGRLALKRTRQLIHSFRNAATRPKRRRRYYDLFHTRMNGTSVGFIRRWTWRDSAGIHYRERSATLIPSSLAGLISSDEAQDIEAKPSGVVRHATYRATRMGKSHYRIQLAHQSANTYRCTGIVGDKAIDRKLTIDKKLYTPPRQRRLILDHARKTTASLQLASYDPSYYVTHALLVTYKRQPQPPGRHPSGNRKQPGPNFSSRSNELENTQGTFTTQPGTLAIQANYGSGTGIAEYDANGIELRMSAGLLNTRFVSTRVFQTATLPPVTLPPRDGRSVPP